MKTMARTVLAVCSVLACSLLTSQDAPPQGDLALPAQAVVFGPFAREDGVPAVELLRRVPATLVLGGRQAAGRPAAFDAQRTLDCAPFCGTEVGGTAWIYLAFVAERAEAVTFGFGADWWYEAYLDGTRISETLSRDEGNVAWPPSIRDFAATVDLAAGPHLLAVRFLRGSGSAKVAIGGPRDLRNPAIRRAPKAPAATVATVTKAATREGPPPEKSWKMVWNEEFDGTALDTGRWNVQPLRKWDWPGMKTEARPENMFLDGKGALVLELTRDPDGTVRHAGSINSHFAKAYGYFETRVQFSRQPGWWTAVWMAGYPYDCGVDGFVNSQEFDIFEDFYKPKKQNDISHCYHCSVKLAVLRDDQGDAKGLGEGKILASDTLGRTSSGRKVVLEDYDGWHTVGFQWTPLEHVFYVDGQETLRQSYREVPITNVPQKIWISSCLRTPKDGKQKPFYGRLEEAELPDRLVVDYVRIYEEDTGGQGLPEVKLDVLDKGPYREDRPVAFRVAATAPQGRIESLMLFSMGRVRAEQAVDGTEAEATFALDNLFPLATNTVVAMARDDAGRVGQSAPIRIELLTGREYTGTAWQGTPQAIPGTVRGGAYDEGGNGVAYRSAATGPSDARLEHRKSEIGSLPEAVEVGGDYAQWITYEVEVAKAGEYEVELFMNRPDHSTRALSAADAAMEEALRLHLGRSGEPGEPLLEWRIARSWNSGHGWRQPQKSLGTRRVRLPAGRHKLILRAEEITVKFTFFCRMVFRPVGE